MGPFRSRSPRRPDDRLSAHERARRLAALRLAEPLGPAHSAWLAEHLTGCERCRAIAAEYEA
ncbi:MAG TPA: hypothetical protein VNJ28_06150, partial [Candidatus Limnocylindrales bacterium]|nr:hypothetical protein [Candidatus Limnocylindrales bacterium]